MRIFSDTAAGPLQQDIAGVVIPRDEISRCVAELAGQIADCYLSRAGEQDRQNELIILAVMTGSLVFLADLIRRLPLRIRLCVVTATSYPGAVTEPVDVRIDLSTLDPANNLAGKDVLVVDDIIDTGRTLRAIMDTVGLYGPASLRTCVLLRKTRDDLPGRIEPDFCGFEAGPEFVVGYGLDFDDLYRNVPDICVLKPHVLQGCREGGSGL